MTTTKGMTLKQAVLARFNNALEEYGDALKSKDSSRIVSASIHIHIAKGGVPKNRWSAINRTARGAA